MSGTSFADTPTENSATVNFDVDTGTGTMSWDFGTHTERDYCLVKTDFHVIPLAINPADALDPDVVGKVFLGTNTNSLYDFGTQTYQDLLADPAKVTEATIPCTGSMTFTIPSGFHFDDIQLFMTFAEIIKDDSHDNNDYTLLDTVDHDFDDDKNINTLHEITIQYSNYIEFNPVQCGGDNRWEIGTEYFKDIYTTDRIVTINAKEICDQSNTGGTVNAEGKAEEESTSADGAFPTTATWYLVFPLTTSDSGGCSDCIDPTFYYSQNKFIVKDGFRYNDYSTNVTAKHTPTPLLITNTTQVNFLTLKVYDNSGTSGIEWIDVGFGSENMYSSLQQAEVVIETKFSDNKIVLGYPIIIDPLNLINFGEVTASVVDCGIVDTSCLQITIPHAFRDNLLYPGITIGATDESGNNKYHYLNDGLEIQGKSLNEAPTDKVFIQKYLGNPQAEWIDIVRIDRVHDIWSSEDGIEFKGTAGAGFQRITPLGFDNTLID
jgi:hypothetical protein